MTMHGNSGSVSWVVCQLASRLQPLLVALSYMHAFWSMLFGSDCSGDGVSGGALHAARRAGPQGGGRAVHGPRGAVQPVHREFGGQRACRHGLWRHSGKAPLCDARGVEMRIDGTRNAVSQASDVDSRMRLYEHVVLSGGNTMFPGLPTRLERELKDLYCTNVLQVIQRTIHTHDTAIQRTVHTPLCNNQHRVAQRACTGSSCKWRTPQPASSWSLWAGRCWQTS